jgi:hypothetical protein
MNLDIQLDAYYIQFILNYIQKSFKLSLEYIMMESNNNRNNNSNSNNNNNNIGKELKTIIKEECLKNNIILTEANIVLYDLENDYIINKTEDLLLHKTKKCKIVIIPVKCDLH